MKAKRVIPFVALFGAMLLVGVPTALAQEGAGIFKSEPEQQVSPDQGWMENQRFYGEYDDDASDNWFYDSYSWEEDVGESEVRGYYSEEGVVDWYTEKNFYTGTFDDTPDENDWFFDAYEVDDEGFWNF